MRLKPGNDCKGSASVASCLCHASRALNLVDVTVNDDHLTVPVGKGAEAEITVFENCLNAYLAIVYSRDERRRLKPERRCG